MRTETAIQTIKIALAEVEWDYPMDYAVAFETAIEALEKQKWHKISEEKPTEEKQYLCYSMYTDRPYFKVLLWSNNLYEVDDFNFHDCKGKCGFYEYDSEYGYFEGSCDYWKPIDWEE